MEVREKWVEMMNAAMERHGHEQRLDAHSLALDFALGAFGTFFFFTRQVSTLNSRFDHLEQLLVTPGTRFSKRSGSAFRHQEEAWPALARLWI